MDESELCEKRMSRYSSINTQIKYYEEEQSASASPLVAVCMGSLA